MIDPAESDMQAGPSHQIQQQCNAPFLQAADESIVMLIESVRALAEVVMQAGPSDQPQQQQCWQCATLGGTAA